MSRTLTNHKQKFGIVPSFLAAQDISANDIRVYIALSVYADKNRQCWPRVAQLSRDTRLSERSVKRATHNLVGADLITKTENRGRGRAPIYTLKGASPSKKGGIRDTLNESVKGDDTDTLYEPKGCHSPSPFSNQERVSPTGPSIEQTNIGQEQGHLGQEGQVGENVIPFRKVAGGEG